MASEKGDMQQDTDSLPPHYASSEVYSDSPPPAYKKTSTVRLQITRVVCFTILTMGLLVGVFTLAHTYVIRHTHCNCETAAEQLPAVSASLVQHLPHDVPGNDIDAAPEPARPDVEVPLDQEEIEEDIMLAEEAAEEESDGLQDLGNPPKNVKLPVNMLLGNPALAGKDVQCKVEKKIQNLGNGVFSKTIMVTCEDDGEDETTEKDAPISPLESMGPMRAFPRPPMSMLAPILKMMAARANARMQNQISPKVVFSRMPMPGSSPFPKHLGGPIQTMPPKMSIMPMPSAENFNSKMISGPPMHMPIPRFNQMRSNIIPMPFLPPNMIRPKMINEDDQNDRRPHNMLFREDFHRENGPINIPESPFNSIRIEEAVEPRDEIEEVIIENESPVQVMRGMPPQIPDAIKEIVSSIMNREGQQSDSRRNMPVIAIKAIPQTFTTDENSTPNQIRLPFPFRPMKIMNARQARKLNIMEPIRDGSISQIHGIPPMNMEPVVMPEAGGRALESPVTIPSPPEMQPLRFFPGAGLVRIPVPLRA